MNASNMIDRLRHSDRQTYRQTDRQAHSQRQTGTPIDKRLTYLRSYHWRVRMKHGGVQAHWW